MLTREEIEKIQTKIRAGMSKSAACETQAKRRGKQWTPIRKVLIVLFFIGTCVKDADFRGCLIVAAILTYAWFVYKS